MCLLVTHANSYQTSRAFVANNDLYLCHVLFCGRTRKVFYSKILYQKITYVRWKTNIIAFKKKKKHNRIWENLFYWKEINNVCMSFNLQVVCRNI